ncbi:hypothetical protein P4056_20235 [Pseudomonas aeruginosa]|nr:hypothetical protein [Pseudomonas aeruginosa]
MATPFRFLQDRSMRRRRQFAPVFQAMDKDPRMAEDSQQLAIGRLRVFQMGEALVLAHQRIEQASLGELPAEGAFLDDGFRIAVSQ